MTQKQIVINQLNEKGFVDRNWCLSKYISRLSAIIQDLEAKGWEFKAYTDGGNYKYELIKNPTQFDTNVYKKEVIEEREHAYRNPTLF